MSLAENWSSRQALKYNPDEKALFFALKLQMAFGQLKPQGHHQRKHHHHHSEMIAKVATDGGHDKGGENVAKPTNPSKPVSWLQSAERTDETVKHQKDGHLVCSRDEVVTQSPNKIASGRPHGKLLKGCEHNHPDIVLLLSGRCSSGVDYLCIKSS
jgi:hypothetical protein